ncbi:hypothetical protein [Wenyingzhuangia sp. IMCC45574]
MELTLKYHIETNQEIAAFYIPLATPEDWLALFDKVNISIDDVTCYLVPTSVSDIKASGLFVVLKDKLEENLEDIKYPYYKIAKRMFLPFNSIVHPPLTSEEFNTKFLYHIQCYHPTIGIIGWEENDFLDWSHINFKLPKEIVNWNLATYEPLIFPEIINLSLIAPDNETEVIESLEEEIEQKDLADIPIDEEENNSSIKNALDKITKGLLKVSLTITGVFLGIGMLIGNLIGGLIGGIGGANFENTLKGKNTSKKYSSGMLKQFQEWLKNNLDKLEKQQNKELNKLLKMMDDNLSEALKYAIPLGGGELGRSSNDIPSFKLMKGSTLFNLNNLNTRVSSYGWDVSHHYFELRQKYIKAAEVEIQNKNYRKAAYIYAHLLKDYSNAANVLEQGGFYEEAAMLHLEKQKNKTAAADCYEKGMLYEKALKIHQELKHTEKVADLYSLLKKEDLSKQYFKEAVDECVDRNDFVNAARIEKDKLLDKESSKTLLLNGWKKSTKSEICLSKYLEETFEVTPKEMSTVVHTIYKKHTLNHKKGQLLNVLKNVSNKEEYGIKKVCSNIAYEIISEDLIKNERSNIHRLNDFVDDQLLSKDINRFVGNKPREKVSTANLEIKLDDTIEWTNAFKHKRDILVTGNNATHWFIARVNQYDNKEYYTLKNPFKKGINITYHNNSSYSNEILIQILNGSNYTPINEEVVMYKNKHFDTELKLNLFNQFQDYNTSITLNHEQYFKLETSGEPPELVIFDKDRKLKKSILIKLDKQFSLRVNNKTIYLLSFIFTFCDSIFYAIDTDTGKTYILNLDTGITGFDAPSAGNILIKTYSGLTIYSFKYNGFVCKTPFFSQDFFGSKAFLLGTSKVIVYSENTIKVFGFKNNLAEEHMTVEYSDSDIISCLPVSRDKYAVLTKSNTIQFIHI